MLLQSRTLRSRSHFDFIQLAHHFLVALGLLLQLLSSLLGNPGANSIALPHVHVAPNTLSLLFQLSPPILS